MDCDQPGIRRLGRAMTVLGSMCSATNAVADSGPEK
jgi:hypothetical protein